MKKLIVMTMVLALVSAVSAGPAWVISVGGAPVDQVALGDTVTASLGLDTLSGLVITPGSVTLSDVTVDSVSILTPKSMGAAPVAAGSAVNFNVYGFGPDAIAGYTPGAEMFSMTFVVSQAAADAGQIDLDASGMTFMVAGSALDIPSAVIPVPEPITMALLGLGGLFIRRRRA